MDISMDIHVKSVDTDTNVDAIFSIHSEPADFNEIDCSGQAH